MAADGVIVVIDSKNNKFDNILDDWVNGFCKNIKVDTVTCFSYSKENDDKFETKQKVCKLYINFSPSIPSDDDIRSY